jgi:hypothetical protein
MPQITDEPFKTNPLSQARLHHHNLETRTLTKHKPNSDIMTGVVKATFVAP